MSWLDLVVDASGLQELQQSLASIGGFFHDAFPIVGHCESGAVLCMFGTFHDEVKDGGILVQVWHFGWM